MSSVPTTASASSPPVPPKHSSNIGIIAGAVVGGVCGLMISVAGIFLLFREQGRRRAKDAALYGPSSALYRPPSTLYTETLNQTSEASGSLYPLGADSRPISQAPFSPLHQQGKYSGTSEPHEAESKKNNVVFNEWGDIVGGN
ncbi:hypothetical protein DL93DRAFT_2090697 [Clavulina sp. PMI_390]|nr:hypothetical protein DL93DRAFT_2090697 [Clavulina sp. PMI_390]